MVKEPLIMGVLNVTPDSFSDGGRYVQVNQAVDHALSMIYSGADVIDIGGESTRPGADPISANEEMDRVLPVLEQLAKDSSIKISIDTRKPEVMAAVLPYTPWMINDIEAFRSAESMVQVAASKAQLVMMHMQGQPTTMQHDPHYPRGVVNEVYDDLAERRQAALQAGVQSERLWLDPGIGFGKSYEDNLKLMQNISIFAQLGCSLMVGVSRKRVLGDIIGKPPLERGNAGLAAAVFLWLNGVRMIRTHDVQATDEARKLIQAVGIKDDE